MKEFARIFVPRFALAILLSLGFALSCAVAHGEVPMEPAGSDVFVTPREALLREKASPRGRILAKLPQGTRLKLVDARDRYLKVEAPGPSEGWIAREVTVLFVPGEAATQDMVVVGRSFGKTDANRRLAACILLRASERLREAKTPDPDVEVLLGETVEGVVAAGAPYPAGALHRRAAGPGGHAAPATTARPSGAPRRCCRRTRARSTRERASARPRACCARSIPSARRRSSRSCRKPRPGSSCSRRPRTRASSRPRPNAPAPRRSRSAASTSRSARPRRSASCETASTRPACASARSRPSGSTASASCRARPCSAPCAATARPSFPQEASVNGGSRQRLVRIDGKIGALQLVVETQAGATRDVQVRKAAIPILPVPGSLRVSPDGRSVAWIEVSAPARLVPVMTSLERDEEAREIAFLSTGRPLRDRELAHVVSSLSGFSKDGQRLGLVIEAWNDTPGPAPRYSVVSVATGELLFETSEDMKGYQRLLR